MLLLLLLAPKCSRKTDSINAPINYLQEDEFEEVEVDVKYKTVTTLDWERVNANVAIWARDKDEITDDEYHNFYKVCTRAAYQYMACTRELKETREGLGGGERGKGSGEICYFQVFALERDKLFCPRCFLWGFQYGS